jgi:hypothetical protein
MKMTQIILAGISCALWLANLTGCAPQNVAAQAAASQSDLDLQQTHLNSAAQHLAEAHSRLAQEPDPRNAGSEINAAGNAVLQARSESQKIGQDVVALSNATESLQHEIDGHRNDLLGPRARRIRNRVILAMVLATLGWGLLRIGPLFGGPLGGGAIVAGHLLTAFAIPILKAAWFALGIFWTWMLGLWRYAMAGLSSLGGTGAGALNSVSTSSTSVEIPSINATTTGVAHAATGSD